MKIPKWIEIRKSSRNHTTYGQDKIIIELKDKDAKYHELGHAIMNELTFGNRLRNSNKKPHFSEAERYARLTYVFGAGEGWAQSFSDFFSRPTFLKKNSPELYDYWKDIKKLNRL